MAHVVWTPWRKHGELLTVRSQLYPPKASVEPDRRREACNLVSWHHSLKLSLLICLDVRLETTGQTSSRGGVDMVSYRGCSNRQYRGQWIEPFCSASKLRDCFLPVRAF